MERLTKENLDSENEVLCRYEEGDCNDSCIYGVCKWRGKALRRLKAYEDILFPEDGKEKITLDRLKELVEADNEGRVVILPCNIGDTIYRPNILNKFVEDKIEHILLKRHETIFRTEVAGNSFFEFKDKQIGNTVFLTRETAEKALEVEKDG